ncbi:hypothetical protein QVD17_31678 [Tagetes erecta]|uniref:TIR domain-containing protein n=1 Tax=Tagetes erecta TaxID=13708 RepID=A0AAD8NH95_TARER|nr:hypothetical protein QVD17_31678 [Tagetes erecta]
MASSSSSSHFVPVSVSKSWTYEVFLSFRGEDTRKGFVGHLYTALEQAGIYTYKDDITLDRGASIAPALLNAIEQSRIAVIVFSENYADSSWCLDELAHIIKCMDEKKQIVMPVFYDMDPSDVKKLRKNYGKAFDEKHELENKHRVELWKEALKKASTISRWVIKDFANGPNDLNWRCLSSTSSSFAGRAVVVNVSVYKPLPLSLLNRWRMSYCRGGNVFSVVTQRENEAAKNQYVI